MLRDLVAFVKQQVEPLFDTEVHSLLGLAGGAFGFTQGNWHDIAAGLGYSLAMKVAGALQSAAAPAPASSPAAASTTVAPTTSTTQS